MSVVPYYEDESCVIYHGDALDVLSALEGSFDLLVADPPYNVGVAYGEGTDDSRTAGDYEAWCRDWFAQGRSLAKSAVVFGGVVNLPMWNRIERPSATGCWFKPGSPRNTHIGYDEWEPWLYWGTRMGGSSVIRVPFVSNLSKTLGHPCPKPLLLYKQLIQRTKAETVLDPFMGIGTTLRAAKDLGRRAVGIEIEERYCELAVTRLAQEVLAV